MKHPIYACPLIGQEVCEGICYEVQAVRLGLLQMSALGVTFDRTQADIMCDICPFNQLPTVDSPYFLQDPCNSNRFFND